MSDLSRYFHSPPEILHPKARRWRAMFDEGRADSAVCELSRPRDGLTFKPARLFVTFHKDGATVWNDEEAWDDELNDELIELRVPAVSQKNEAERFGLMMRSQFSSPEGRYGDGYFNAVLNQYLRSSPFSERAPIAAMLSEIRENAPKQDTVHFEECRAAVEDVIVTTAHTLEQKLGYPRENAEQILTDALGYYLDERFSLTNRRLLGLH